MIPRPINRAGEKGVHWNLISIFRRGNPLPRVDVVVVTKELTVSPSTGHELEREMIIGMGGGICRLLNATRFTLFPW